MRVPKTKGDTRKETELGYRGAIHTPRLAFDFYQAYRVSDSSAVLEPEPDSGSTDLWF